ncbi:MAG: ABC transporter permease [Clostridia bacterium]|nr:ABC transporter permease [Clostridia bacterium]
MANTKKASSGKLLKFILIPEVTSIIPVLIVAIVATILNPIFLRGENLLTLASSLISSWGILAIGQAFIIMSGGLDISIGTTLSFAGMIFCLLARSGMPLAVCILAVFAVCIAMSLLNSLLILKFNVWPFVATMSVQYVGKGLANVVNYGADMSVSYGTSDAIIRFTELMGRKPLGLSIGAIVFIILIFVAQFILKKTAFGRKVYAVGDNARVAKVAGIRVWRIRTMCFVIAGITTALATIIWVGYYAGCTPTQGNPWSFITIAAVAMGGVSLKGGSGSMFGVFFGVLLMGLVYNLITLLNINSNFQNIFIGVFLALSVVLDTVRREKTLGKNI